MIEISESRDTKTTALNPCLLTLSPMWSGPHFGIQRQPPPPPGSGPSPLPPNDQQCLILWGSLRVWSDSKSLGNLVKHEDSWPLQPESLVEEETYRCNKLPPGDGNEHKGLRTMALWVNIHDHQPGGKQCKWENRKKMPLGLCCYILSPAGGLIDILANVKD